MLEEALGYAREHDLPKVYILIDEYDNFTNQLLTAYKDPLYEQVTTKDSFLRTFFKVIKKGIGEGSIRTCFCTGVLPRNDGRPDERVQYSGDPHLAATLPKYAGIYL